MNSRQPRLGSIVALRAARWLFAALALGLGIATLAGCAGTISFGAPPRTDRLQSLKIGTSDAKEVITVLGEPRGPGIARFDAAFPDTDIWFYELVESDGSATKLNMLLVFIRKDVYVGHMWFASKQLVGRTE
jgi:hypothetical protein